MKHTLKVPDAFIDELKYIRKEKNKYVRMEAALKKKMQMFCPHNEVVYKIDKIKMPNMINNPFKSYGFYKPKTYCKHCGKRLG